MSLSLLGSPAPAAAPRASAASANSPSASSSSGADRFAAALRDTALTDPAGSQPAQDAASSDNDVKPGDVKPGDARSGDASSGDDTSADLVTQSPLSGDLVQPTTTLAAGSLVLGQLAETFSGASPTAGAPDAPLGTATGATSSAPASGNTPTQPALAAATADNVATATATSAAATGLTAASLAVAGAVAAVPGVAVPGVMVSGVTVPGVAAPGIRATPAAPSATTASALGAPTAGTSAERTESLAGVTGGAPTASPTSTGIPSGTVPPASAPGHPASVEVAVTTAPVSTVLSDESPVAAGDVPAVAVPSELTLKHASADPSLPIVAAPTGTSQVAAATPTTAHTPVAPTAPVPLTEQIARPLLALAGAADGEHTLTLTVTPDNLGPVTVRAHVAGEHIRIELFSPNDASREAVKQILTDLRRDLASQGLGAQLDLSGKNQPDSGEGAGSGRQPSHEPAARGRQREAEQQLRRPVGGQTSMLDVLA